MGRATSDPAERAQVVERVKAEEIDFVRSALEETMIRAYQIVHRLWKTRELPDLKTAAFLHAIDRVAEAYVSQGIFP